ncbi:MAG: DUF5615 family PIN-like protein [Bacteroidia bacterium]|nr:DUF5615 family PIN-like protein [Bacteroidia bacterium]
MKFILDAHIPLSLIATIISNGHEAMHTKDLPIKNNTPDDEIIDFSIKNNCIVITTDSDFYYSHTLFGKPEKLLLIKTGNTRTKALKNLFEKYFDEIITAFKKYNLIELHYDCLIY